MNFLQKVFGGKQEASYKIRNAGPGVPIETRIRVYDGPPRDMPIDQMVERRKRLAEILPQFKAKKSVLIRKQSAHYAAALSGAQGAGAKSSAEWLMSDIGNRADARVADLEQRIKIFDQRIKAALANAGVQ